MKLVLTCEHGGNDIPDAYKNTLKIKRFYKRIVL